MYHILESSVSWQWLPDVVGEICSYVDTSIFLLDEEESFLLIFQTATMEVVHPALPSKGSLWVPWKEHTHREIPLPWLLGHLLLHPHEHGGVGGAVHGRVVRSKAGKNSCSHRSSQNWWILITSSQYLCSFLIGPSLCLLVVHSNYFSLYSSVSPFPS